MFEYALILAAVATMATGANSLSAGVARQLPTSQTKAESIVSETATAKRVPPAGARAALRSAPYRSVKLKYLYAVGWVGGKHNRFSCPFFRYAGDRVGESMVDTVKKDPALLRILRRSSVPVDVAAEALGTGVLAGCAQ